VKRNVVDFSSNSKAIDDEASAWLARMDSDRPLIESERAALRDWLQRSPEHYRALKERVDVWTGMNALTELWVPLDRPVERTAGAKGGPDHGWPFIGRLTAALAASLIVAVVLPLAFWPSADTLYRSNGHYVTAVGEQKRLSLSDGSEITLNTDSHASVVFGEDYRDIQLLRGEAHFQVAVDIERPFRVLAGVGRIQAVGTAFSVYVRGRDVDITVAEGAVSLATVHDGRSASNETRMPESDRTLGVEPLGMLTAGQSTVITSRHSGAAAGSAEQPVIRTIEKAEMAKRFAWRDGLLIFSGESLEDVVGEISRYTTVAIEIADPHVRSMQIGGQFPVGEIEALLDTLESNFGLTVTRLDDGRVRLSAGVQQ
jgi:transmembrane sensor